LPLVCKRVKLSTILFFVNIVYWNNWCICRNFSKHSNNILVFLNPIPLVGDAAKTMIDMGIEPFMYFSIQPDIYYIQALIVLIITMLISIYPIIKSFTLKLTTALHG